MALLQSNTVGLLGEMFFLRNGRLVTQSRYHWLPMNCRPDCLPLDLLNTPRVQLMGLGKQSCLLLESDCSNRRTDKPYCYPIR